MLRRKRIRTRGKLSLGRYFQELKEGDKVCLVRELSMKGDFPARMQGKTGVIVGKRGRSYVVDVMDYNEKKTYLIRPIHLKKLKG